MKKAWFIAKGAIGLLMCFLPIYLITDWLASPSISSLELLTARAVLIFSIPCGIFFFQESIKAWLATQEDDGEEPPEQKTR